MRLEEILKSGQDHKLPHWNKWASELKISSYTTAQIMSDEWIVRVKELKFVTKINAFGGIALDDNSSITRLLQNNIGKDVLINVEVLDL